MGAGPRATKYSVRISGKVFGMRCAIALMAIYLLPGTSVFAAESTPVSRPDTNVRTTAEREKVLDMMRKAKVKADQARRQALEGDQSTHKPADKPTAPETATAEKAAPQNGGDVVPAAPKTKRVKTAKDEAEEIRRELAEAQRKAEARHQAKLKREAQAKAAAERKATAQRKAKEQQAAEAQRLAREEDQRRAQAERAAAAQRKAEAERLAQQKREAEEQRLAGEARSRDARRRAEARRLENERRQREARLARQRERDAQQRNAERARDREATRLAQERQEAARLQRRDVERRLAEQRAQQERRRQAEIEQQRADEADLLRRARADYERRQQRVLEADERGRRTGQASRQQVGQDGPALQERGAQTDLNETEVTDDRAALTAKRDEEARKLSERLRAAREAHEERQFRSADDNASDNSVVNNDATASTRDWEPYGDDRDKRSNRDASRTSGRNGTSLSATPPLRQAPNGGQNEPSGEYQRPYGLTGAPASPSERPPGRASNSRERVAVLLVMKPGKRGIRRWNKKADPILCVGRNSCYISKGAGLPARKLKRKKALGAVVALGMRADACRNKLACVFRNVDLGGARGKIQPVDLRVVRHDRRKAKVAGVDTSCSAQGGRLSCAQLVRSSDWQAWIVPEALAEEAGADVLRRAVEGGLETSRRAYRGNWSYE